MMARAAMTAIAWLSTIAGRQRSVFDAFEQARNWLVLGVVQAATNSKRCAPGRAPSRLAKRPGRLQVANLVAGAISIC